MSKPNAQQNSGPNVETVAKEMLAMWLNNPMMDVFLEAAALTMLSVTSLRNPALNDPKVWAPGFDRPKSADALPDPTRYELRSTFIRTASLHMLFSPKALLALIESINKVMETALALHKPIYGSMRLQFMPAFNNWPETSQDIVCRLYYLSERTEQDDL